MMSYTDGRRSPAPTKSERAFAELTDQEREAMTKQWLKRRVGKTKANRFYTETSGPVEPEIFP